uniref:DDB1-and CUL4-associated factor 15 n=1 Tax=Ceratitis capitata TaxID=7213 RepID=W8C9T5_CERCA
MEADFHAFAESLYASSEEEDDFSTVEDSSDESDGASSGGQQQICSTKLMLDANSNPKNLVHRICNRERTNNISGKTGSPRAMQCAFDQVPNRLRFCLKDIVPKCFLQGHMFMGLSACGQFLLSYKVCCNDNIMANHYSFGYGYKYTLYFWVYQPHKPLRSFFKCCLFDDHGVDNLKKVTMTQWKCSDPRILIVHGAAENENEDSYITYVKVPKLGCLDCRKLRDNEDSTYFRWHMLCLKCNLTIHTKYSSTESDPKFQSHINLICPERILIVSNGFMHMMHIELMPAAVATSTQSQTTQQQHQLPNILSSRSTPCHESSGLSTFGMERRILPLTADEQASCDNHNNVIARIIADFSDIETDSTHSSETPTRASQSEASITSPGSAVTFISRKTYDEVIFTCSGSASPNTGAASTSSAANNVPRTAETAANTAMTGINSSPGGGGGGTARFSLINHRGRRHHRIVTKSFRNGVTTIDLQTTMPTTTSAAVSATMADRLNAYEFTEDNEKCEKISTLRKRRLADKKYEFSEDNSENIVPFTKIRSASKNLTMSHYTASYGSSGSRSLHRSATTTAASGTHHFYNSPGVSPSSSPRPSHASPSNYGDARHCTPPPIHRVSPITSLQQGFRSPPCSSPVAGGGLIRSPSRHVTSAHIYGSISPPQTISTATQQMLSFKPLGTLSPLQVSLAKRHLDLSGAMSPNANAPYLSPRREENRVVELPLHPGAVTEKPLCTKKFKRRFVEEDDAASVITSEEDDCISPGYHTSLPVEVHGSCYSEMQMVSQATYQKLNCPSVVITQHSFDLETFTYYTISALCQKNEKTYDVFYDWACELIRVCPLSQTIICLLMAQFTARDQLPTSPTNCLNCSLKLDCIYHRRQFECRILFTWNMENGEWEVLDYGELHECKQSDLISPIKRCGRMPVTLAQTAKSLAKEMSLSLSKIEQNYTSNLRVLDSNIKKSKLSLADHDNAIELCLKRPRGSNDNDDV